MIVLLVKSLKEINYLVYEMEDGGVKKVGYMNVVQL